MKVVPVISMFTGGGLFDLGFEQAGFSVAWTNEVNPSFADMYGHAMSAWGKSRDSQARSACITNRNRIEDIPTELILEQAFGSTRPSTFGLIGGPPCPDFSVGGLNEGAKGMNGRLTTEFVSRIGALDPTFFVMENVPGLVRTLKHRSHFLRIIQTLRCKYGYLLDWTILNSLEYGIAQKRERVFVVGIKMDRLRDSFVKSLGRRRSGWFPWPTPTFPNAAEYPWPRTDAFGGQPQMPEGVPLELTVWPLVGGIDDPEELPNGQDYFTPQSLKFSIRSEGDVHSKSFKRLHRYRFSPTAWYGNNEVHLHPWKARRLSVRESLRIQSVPDSYVLPEDFPLSHKFKLVGNGVPCKLAEVVAESINSFLKTYACP